MFLFEGKEDAYNAPPRSPPGFHQEVCVVDSVRQLGLLAGLAAVDVGLGADTHADTGTEQAGTVDVLLAGLPPVRLGSGRGVIGVGQQGGTVGTHLLDLLFGQGVDDGGGKLLGRGHDVLSFPLVGFTGSYSSSHYTYTKTDSDY